MKTHELRGLARDVAIELGATLDTTKSADGEVFAWLLVGPAWTLQLRAGGYRRDGRVLVGYKLPQPTGRDRSLIWPRDLEKGTKWVHDITVSDERNAWEIAREIKRRLLPTAEEFTRRAHERIAARLAHEKKVDFARAQLAECGVMSRDDYGRTLFYSAPDQPLGVDDVRDDTVRMSAETVPVELAVLLLKTARDWQSAQPAAD